MKKMFAGLCVMLALNTSSQAMDPKAGHKAHGTTAAQSPRPSSLHAHAHPAATPSPISLDPASSGGNATDEHFEKTTNVDPVLLRQAWKYSTHHAMKQTLHSVYKILMPHVSDQQIHALVDKHIQGAKAQSSACPRGTLKELKEVLAACEDCSDLKKERLAVLQLAENYHQALSQARPKLRIQGSATMSADRTIDHSQQGNNRSAEETVKGNDRRIRGDLRLEQPFYAGGALKAKREEARYALQAGIQNLRAKEQQVRLEVIKLFLDIKELEEALKVAQVSEIMAEALKAINQAGVQAGNQHHGDLSSAEARLASARVECQRTRSNLLQQRKQLQNYLDKPLAAELIMPELPNIPFTSAQQLTAAALKNNAQILSLQQNHSAKRQAARGQYGGFLPSINFEAVAGPSRHWMHKKPESNGALISRRKSTTPISGSASITVSIPLLSGGQQQSLYRAAEVGVAQAHVDLSALCDDVRVKCANTYELWCSQKYILVAAQAAAEAAAKALNFGITEYREGVLGFVEALYHKETWSSSTINYFSACKSYIFTHYQLMALCGQLTPHAMGYRASQFDVQPYINRYAGTWLGTGPQDKMQDFQKCFIPPVSSEANIQPTLPLQTSSSHALTPHKHPKVPVQKPSTSAKAAQTRSNS